jgi:hypothetical protein
MVFDKNQESFPSAFCREVWWWAVGIVPVDVSLTDVVKSQCDEDTLLGCYQWHDYFNALCDDMYTQPQRYAPASPRQYRDILEYICINGELQGDSVVMSSETFEKYENKINKSTAYNASGIKLCDCISALGYTGLTFEHQNEFIYFTNTKHPKIFHAMTVFEKSPNVRKTPARHHFAHCEFRQLFKSYSANYNELLRPLSDESLIVAKEIDIYAKSLKIQRYVHFDTIKYKHENMRVLDYSIIGNEYPTLRVNICTEGNVKVAVKPFSENMDSIKELIAKRKAYIENEVFI